MAVPQKVVIGAPMREFVGGSFNALVDGYWQQRAAGGKQRGTRSGSLGPALTVLVKNNSGAAREPGHVLGVDELLLTLTEEPSQVYREPIVQGITPTTADHASKFVVCRDHIVAGEVGPAWLLGCGWVKANITDTGHTHLAIADGVADYLESGTSGYEIIWKESGTGTKWALVLLGGGGGGGGGGTYYPPKIVLVDVEIPGAKSAVPEVQMTAADVTVTPVHSGTAQSGSTSTTIKLASGASAVDDAYTGATVTTTGGTGSGQTRVITDYVGATRVATVAAWGVTPDATTTYDITYTVVFQDPPDDDYSLNHRDYLNGWKFKHGEVNLKVFESDPVEHAGTAQDGDTDTIQLEDTASTVADFYVGSTIEITAGTGSGQTKTITAYDEATFTATVDSAWSTPPDATSEYEITSDVYAKLATYTINDDDGHRAIVRYQTVKVRNADDKPVTLGTYQRSDYPDYPELEDFPPDGTGTYQELPAGFLSHRYRALVTPLNSTTYLLTSGACKLLPAPSLPLA